MTRIKPPFQEMSLLMKLLLRFRANGLAWAFRRAFVPVSTSALVLEVGSGGNPFFRSNILCDAYMETRERHFDPLTHDRPTILAYVENLPFKDNSMDFVVACHVLEHSKEPEQFLSELQRVAKAGYIECPDAFFERLTCYLDHRLEVTDIDDTLIIRKKKDYIQDQEVNALFRHKVGVVFSKIVKHFPFHFNVRYFWSKESGGISYKVLNSQDKIDWESPITDNKVYTSRSLKSVLRTAVIRLLRRILSQNRRNRCLNVFHYLMCIKCKQSDFEIHQVHILCKSCGATYQRLDHNIIDFTQPK